MFGTTHKEIERGYIRKREKVELNERIRNKFRTGQLEKRDTERASRIMKEKNMKEGEEMKNEGRNEFDPLSLFGCNSNYPFTKTTCRLDN